MRQSLFHLCNKACSWTYQRTMHFMPKDKVHNRTGCPRVVGCTHVRASSQSAHSTWLHRSGTACTDQALSMGPSCCVRAEVLMPQCLCLSVPCSRLGVPDFMSSDILQWDHILGVNFCCSLFAGFEALADALLHLFNMAMLPSHSLWLLVVWVSTCGQTAVFHLLLPPCCVGLERY